MPDRNLRFVLSGVDQSASSTLGKAAKSGQDASAKIGGAFTKLGGQIGGEFGEVLNRVGDGIEQTGEKGLSLGKKMAIGGAAIAGVGLLLTAAGSKEKQATDQLRQSVDNTGASYEDYAGKIEKVVKREENFAHSAADTKTALRTLTDATGDEQKALDNMQLVTDLAAAKHISLADAAALVAKVLSGKGGKVLAAYGIIMKTNADGTKNTADAIQQLGEKVKGQASASMDNFGAKVAAVKTKLTDFVGEVGQKVGPVLTVAGTVIGVVSGGLDILASRAERAAAKELALAAAEERAAVTGAAAGAGSLEAAAGNEALAASSGRAGMAMGRAVIGAAGLVGAVYGLGELAKGPIQRLTGETDGFGYAMEHSAGIADTFKQALSQSGGAVDKNVSSTAALTLQQSGLADKAGKAGISLAAMTAGLTGTDEQFGALIDTWQKSGDPSGKTIMNLIAMRGEFTSGKVTAKQYTEAVAGVAPASKATAKEQAALAGQITKVRSTVLSAAGQLNLFNSYLDKLSNNTLDAAQQELALKDALAGATQQVKDNGHWLNDNTVKGRSNKEWLLTQIHAVNDHAASVGKQTGSVRKATAALASDEAQLRHAAIAAGLNKTQVDALIRSYALTPKKVSTLIKADTADAKAKVRALQAQIDALHGRTVPIIVQEIAKRAAGSSGTNLASHATGGYLSEGWNTAGEGSATELMYKQGSTVQVLTNQQSRPKLASGGITWTGDVIVQAGTVASPVDLPRLIIGALEKAFAAGETVAGGSKAMR